MFRRDTTVGAGGGRVGWWLRCNRAVGGVRKYRIFTEHVPVMSWKGPFWDPNLYNGDGLLEGKCVD